MKFEVVLQQKCAVIKCWEHLVRENGDELVNVLSDLATRVATSDLPAIVIDLLNQSKVDPAFLRKIMAVSQLMKQNKKQIYVINVPPIADKTIRQQGMDQALKIMPDLNSVIEAVTQKYPPKPTPPPKLDVNFINPFIEGILETFRVQCSLDPKVGKPYLRGKGPAFSPDIAGVLGFKSKVFNGVVAICFPEKVFLTVLSKMFGEEYKTIPENMEDGASELVNIIFGFAKKRLNEKGYVIEMTQATSLDRKTVDEKDLVVETALPKILKGSNIYKNLGADYTVQLPFQIESGTFQLEIGIRGKLAEAPDDDLGIAT